MGVAFGALIGALLPAVYGLQVILDQTLGTEVWLEGSLQVRVAGQDPLLLELALSPVPGIQDGVELQGTARLHQPTYPWKSTEFTGALWLRLENTLLEAPPGAMDQGWSASYTVGDEQGTPTHSPVPCQGRLVVEANTQRSPVGSQPLSKHGDLDLTVAFSCTSPGPDGRWATGDDLTWLLNGDLDLRRARRPRASAPL